VKPPQVAYEVRQLLATGELGEGGSLLARHRAQPDRALRGLASIAARTVARLGDGRVPRSAGSCGPTAGRLIRAEEEAIDDPEVFGLANARFHGELVAMTGIQTLTVLYELLNEVVTRAVTAVSQFEGGNGSTAARHRGVRSPRRLAELVELADAEAAEPRWHLPVSVVGRVLLGQQVETVVDLMDHL
jgi:hypothetical protein